MKKFLRYSIIAIVLFTAFAWLNNTSLFSNPQAGTPVLLAHRGLAQTYTREDLERDTCTATRINPPEHEFIENTLPSMEAAFAAGADIAELARCDVQAGMAKSQQGMDLMFKMENLPKPIIAAVNGFALGGGCEVAMMCDFIIAADNAKFGQPEITIGAIPGAGGTQRLTRAVGKAIAMEVILNDRRLTAQEAYGWGLVNRVAPVDRYLEEALELGNEIAARAPVAVRLAKEAVNYAFESTLAAGVAHERRLFYTLFATEDQKEGMRAFVEKRKPKWSGK